MHPYVKLHKPLRLIHYLILCMMILTPVNARTCNGDVRPVQLYSAFTKGCVHVADKRVIARNSHDSRNILQMVRLDTIYFALYDQKAKKFICWERDFSNLIPRRNPKDLRFCTFSEQVSRIHRNSYTRFITTYRMKNGTEREVELRFNKFGNYGTKAFIRKCLGRKKKMGHYIDNYELMPNIDTLNYTNKTSEAYLKLSKLSLHCVDSDFLVEFPDDGDCSLREFCDQMRKIRKKHPIACELSRVCGIPNRRCDSE